MPENGLPLAEMVLAAGALGTAAFGIVEGLKWTALGRGGFKQIPKTLGDDLMDGLHNAYGPKYSDLLMAQYRNGRGKGELPRTLRQGIRIGLRPGNAEKMAGQVGVVDGADLTAISEKLRDGDELDAAEKSKLGRFELAVDARIDAALALAERAYLGWVRGWATIFSIGLAMIAAWVLYKQGGDKAVFQWQLALIVGVAAVPLAPIAKDVSKALQSAATAIRAGKT